MADRANPPAGRKQRTNPWHVAAAIGLSAVALVLTAGAILSAGEANKGDWDSLPSLCELDHAGYDTAIFTPPTNLASPQWVMGAVLITTFILRKHVFEPMASRIYPDMPAFKQTKIANYALELVSETAGLVAISWAGCWQLFFAPEELVASPSAIVSPDVAKDLAVASNLMFSILVSSYILQIAFDTQIRIELALHHWTCLLLVMWSFGVQESVKNNVYMLRCVFAMTLYLLTEQLVFIELLCYQKNIRSATLFKLNAWFYALSRPAIAVLSLYTWWESKPVFFDSGLPNNTFVYALWLFVPIGNVILNATQIATVQSLFGIAKKVALEKTLEKAKAGPAAEKELVTIAGLSPLESFAFDDPGALTPSPSSGSSG